EQKSLQSNQYQQQQLLSISKNNEAAYSALVTAKKKEADAINAKLFVLAGGSNPIPFGKAYQYAVAASNITGVDPAFLLAILTQESNLGTNQGMCFLRDTSTGSGVGAHTGRTFENVMSLGNIPDFMTITSTLGIDPFNTVVSCPQSIGYGGAMGPAQFEPSTWMLFSNRVGKALGFTSMADPWNPQDAFMASALYLSDLGAGAGTWTAESNAACRYYSGRTCAHSSLIASYGYSVMSLASSIQQNEINKLTGI
ncbi:MAG: lytic murein transglycosylase, partial [Patescibacteria group bacterium]|nr:lytic murein transglycosylase [Patescibacteria group bacterium]